MASVSARHRQFWTKSEERFKGRTVSEVANGVANTPPLLNDSVMPYITPAMFLEWLRWKLETPAWILQHFESLVLDKAGSQSGLGSGGSGLFRSGGGSVGRGLHVMVSGREGGIIPLALLYWLGRSVCWGMMCGTRLEIFFGGVLVVLFWVW